MFSMVFPPPWHGRFGIIGDPGLALKAGEERNGGEWRSGAIQARGSMDCDTLTMNNYEYL